MRARMYSQWTAGLRYKSRAQQLSKSAAAASPGSLLEMQIVTPGGSDTEGVARAADGASPRAACQQVASVF